MAENTEKSRSKALREYMNMFARAYMKGSTHSGHNFLRDFPEEIKEVISYEMLSILENASALLQHGIEKIKYNLHDFQLDFILHKNDKGPYCAHDFMHSILWNLKLAIDLAEEQINEHYR